MVSSGNLSVQTVEYARIGSVGAPADRREPGDADIIGPLPRPASHTRPDDVACAGQHAQHGVAQHGAAQAVADGGMADFDRWWERILPFWHLLYVGLLSLAMLTTTVSGGTSWSQRWAILGVLAFMMAAYGLVGRHLFEGPGGWPAAGYLTVTWGGFYSIILIADGSTPAYFLLFAMFPQVWAFLTPRAAAVTSVIVTTGEALVELHVAGWGWEAAARYTPIAVMQAGLVLLVGLLMVGMVRQAERRATLIDELEATRSELAETERARGVLEERQRLAHEIHDTLAQGFTSILALSQAIEVALERRPEAVRDRLALLEETARENLAEARALIHALAPADLQQASLADAVRRVTERFAAETGVQVELSGDAVERLDDGEAMRLPMSREIVLLRTVQEALANVRKHAGATRVQVTLSLYGNGDGPASVTVSDDGHGFDPDSTDGGSGFGLIGMRARAQEVGGGLDVRSAPGAGATVRVHVSR
ncbi:sensor histidine kinase [Phytoactinopolyspora halotolerans]|uniref:Oxygen sensor histidine kinase NreB n=1 Tax=Phytoactinopolyspora halotolerans TaxID=1981512 RepID=A0A6L9S7Y5_9ACTN|nr:sensor histidine kinase [Phytoactinopolyspora halotolerans]NEE00672.1 sensor histidine kinase [Phytoactinopolyspora halotolerans]